MFAGVFATMALLNTAQAATAACPLIKDIQQMAMQSGGYRYETSQPDGHTWTGENPQASASYLTDSAFHDARYDALNKAVTCTYEGPTSNDASFSLTLKPVPGWNLIPIAHWKGTYCEDSDVNKCAFTYQ